MKLRSIGIMAIVVGSLVALSAPPAQASHCNVFAPTTVGFDTFSVTIPLPPSVGPVTVPQQTVGGQTVGGQTVGPFTTPPVGAGPFTVPLIASISGIPVVGTLTIGGQTVGPIFIPSQTVGPTQVPSTTVPQQTVGPVTAGPVPTGLDPIVITVFGQSASVPLDPVCLIETVFETQVPQCIPRTQICFELVDILS